MRERDTPSTASQLDISTQQQPNAVLRVIIDSMIYPVTLDVLHSIFSRYGKVLRIITFNKNSKFLITVFFVSREKNVLPRKLGNHGG